MGKEGKAPRKLQGDSETRWQRTHSVLKASEMCGGERSRQADKDEKWGWEEEVWSSVW